MGGKTWHAIVSVCLSVFMTSINTSVVTFRPGMYLLRHPGGTLAPVTLSRAPGKDAGQGTIQRMGTPGTDDEVLRSAADCIAIVVAGAPVDLLVSAFLANPGDAVPKLRVDRVSLEEPRQAAPAVQATVAQSKPAEAPAEVSKPIRVKAHGISLIGHLGAAGDAVAAEGELLGDVDNGKLEGFQAMWPDRPEGVDLAYRIGVEGAGTSAIVQTGKFVGTRGKGHRITEVGFALVGPKAAGYKLEGKAHFSGGFVMPISSGVTLSGPSGMEHLTALSLRAQAAALSKNSAPPKAAPHGSAKRGKKRG